LGSELASPASGSSTIGSEADKSHGDRRDRQHPYFIEILTEAAIGSTIIQDPSGFSERQI
jgi:hypothetical protein